MTVRADLYNETSMDSQPDKGLTLVLGPPNSGKRGAVLDWWQERMERKPVIVMPTGPDARSMTAEMAERMGGLVGQSPALTFAGLAQAVLGRACRYTDSLEQRVVISRLLRSVSLEGLRELTHLPGMTGALQTLFLELGDSGRTVEQIKELLDRWVSLEPKVAGVAGDIGRLFAEYEKSVDHLGSIDRPVAVREAADACADWDRPVAFCSFTSFTRGQRRLVEALTKEAEILVTLSHERDRGVGLSAPGEFEWWSGRATRLVDMDTRDLAYRARDIGTLERSMLGGVRREASPEAGEPGAEGVRFLLSSGRRAEAELAAQQVASLLRSGVAPGDIAIVVRKVRSWGRLLKDVLGSCGISCQADERVPLVETGLGYSFLQALRSIVSDDGEALLSYLRSPYSGVDAEVVCGLEARYRRGMEKGAQALAALGGKGVKRSLELVLALAGMETTTEGRSSSAAHLDLAEAKRLAELMLAAGVRGMAPAERTLEDDARAFRGLVDGLDALTLAGEREVAEPEEVLGLLMRAEAQGRLDVDPEAVQILSVQRARARRFEAVFVLGLVEGEFPGLSETSSILTSAQRARLDSLAGGLFPPAPQEEHLLFVGAATRAWSVLGLSSRDAEDDGSEAMPSRFWTEARDLLGVGEKGHESRTLAHQVFEPSAAPTLRHYLRACAADGLEPRLRSVPEAGKTRSQVAELSSARVRWRRGPARLSLPVVLGELKAMECFGPSALESYARCPFAWFIERIVGTEELEFELDGRVVGELVHGVLRDCYRSFAEDGMLPLSAEVLPEALSTADVLIERAAAGAECPGSRAERRLVAQRLKGMVRGLFEAEAGSDTRLVFREGEVSLGGSEGVDIGGLRIRGRVDRLDFIPEGEGLFVIDYKSKSIPSARAIGDAEGLQLPLYLLGIAAEQPEVEVLGGAYLSLADGAMSGVVSAGREEILGRRPARRVSLGKSDWKEAAARALEVARGAVAGMRTGVIVAEAQGGCPGWCALNPLCRREVEGRGQ